MVHLHHPVWLRAADVGELTERSGSSEANLLRLLQTVKDGPGGVRQEAASHAVTSPSAVEPSSEPQGSNIGW